MTFRQKGQEKETPQEFLRRRLTLVRFLNPGIESPEETHLVAEAMPPAWNTILDCNKVWDINMFLMQAKVMKRALVESIERKQDLVWNQLKTLIDNCLERTFHTKETNEDKTVLILQKEAKRGAIS